MTTNTMISWTTHTWNPWWGCTPTWREACKACYARDEMKKYGHDPNIVRRAKAATFNRPLAKDQAGEWKWKDGEAVFMGSWMDWCHPEGDSWREEIFAIIRQRPGLIFHLLTHRYERIQECLPADWADGYPNVWIIASVSTQGEVEDARRSLDGFQAAVKGLSIEPILEDISIPFRYDALDDDVLDWVIVGAESRSGRPGRPCHSTWVKSIIEQCRREQVPVFVKQLHFGGQRQGDTVISPPTRLSREPSEWPLEYRVQEFPDVRPS